MEIGRMLDRKVQQGMNSRGMMFTFVVLIALSLVFLIAYSSTRQSITTKQQIYEARILTMNDFVKSFESDSERAAYIAAFRSLIALEDYVSQNAAFVNDTEFYFRQLFYYGNISGDDFKFDIMNASTFRDYERRVNLIARQVNMDFTTQVSRIDLEMANPWTVRVKVYVGVNLTDLSDLARWRYNTTVIAHVPIVDLRDPMYSVHTLGKLPVIVRKSPFTIFVNDTDDRNDTQNLQTHLNESFYISNPMAPNFLMRFENRIMPDENGIESLVNLQVLADQGVYIGCNEYSVVDYLYFNKTETELLCRIQNMEFPPDYWFVIDKEHIDIYQINNTLEHGPCTC